jgi:hypothetical protein
VLLDSQAEANLDSLNENAKWLRVEKTLARDQAHRKEIFCFSGNHRPRSPQQDSIFKTQVQKGNHIEKP